MALLFQTTPEQLLCLPDIVTAMNQSGLDQRFVTACEDLAKLDQGAYELMELWLDAEFPQDRDEIVKDLREILRDEGQCP